MKAARNSFLQSATEGLERGVQRKSNLNFGGQDLFQFNDLSLELHPFNSAIFELCCTSHQ